MKKVRSFIFMKYFKETFMTDTCDFRKKALKSAFWRNSDGGFKYFESKNPITFLYCPQNAMFAHRRQLAPYSGSGGITFYLYLHSGNPISSSLFELVD